MLTFILLLIACFIVWKLTKAKPTQNPSSTIKIAQKRLPGSKVRKIPRDYQNIEYDKDGWVHIQNPDFFGQYSKSPNGKFSIAWSDSDPKGYVGGFREA